MVILDVRTKEEYDNGHIEGAKLFDIIDMMQGSFPDVKKDEVITVYCQTGNRSAMAKGLLEKAGFTNVADGGGINDMAKNIVR
ncbi:MAG: rhodanese-like domain-containing protein [Patescibacteria group bacterium]|nr:rhodanese-like domain-containing protein [Patescibacteria group bacterium]